MNFLGNVRGCGTGEDKEENEQPPITQSPLLFSSSSSFPHHHHHEPFFSPPRYNHHQLYRGGENEESSGFNMVEREHMFDKVVTPSDVGKLNRLVIPKQHAERYFPLDSSTNYKGLLLNFEDRSGKLWRFQYSYWNSSQSYVMTKGWSRFVKEKKLDAGDIVSFQRGVGVTAKDRLFIDWRRRVNPNTPPRNLSVSSDLSFLFQNHNFINPVVLQSLPARRNPNFMLQAPNTNPNCTSSRSVGFGTTQHQFGLGFDHNLPPPVVPVSADHHSTPDLTPLVDHGKVSGKRRLRLFGVNMDCVFSEEDGAHEDATVSAVAGCGTIDPLISSSSSSFSTIPYLQLMPNYGGESEFDQSAMLSKSAVSNMSLDLKM